MAKHSYQKLMAKVEAMELELKQTREDLHSTKKEVEVLKQDNQQLANNDLALKQMVDKIDAKEKKPIYFG